jgi:hypothetical protein
MGKVARKNDPALWEGVKSEVTEGDKGGRAGQWSAREAQLATQDYKRRGGGYVGRKPDDNSLKRWTEEEWGTESGEEWGTESGEKSTETGERYLPKRAREGLSDEEYRRTSAKKRADARRRKQFSGQPADVARKTAAPRRRAGRQRRPGAEPGRALRAGEAARRPRALEDEQGGAAASTGRVSGAGVAEKVTGFLDFRA